jgi:hypothetical protein
MSRIEESKLFMYLPDTQSCWANSVKEGHWFTLRGTHDIEEIDGQFYNHYGKEPKLVSNGKDRIILTREEVERFGKNIKIDDFALKQMLCEHTFLRYSEEEVQQIAKRTPCGIAYIITSLIEDGFFSRKILLKNNYNHSAYIALKD